MFLSVHSSFSFFFRAASCRRTTEGVSPSSTSGVETSSTANAASRMMRPAAVFGRPDESRPENRTRRIRQANAVQPSADSPHEPCLAFIFRFL